MSDQLLDSVIRGPDKPDYATIWLHGLGADGYDFEPIAAELDFPTKNQTRFIFPHAPSRAVTINGGMRMPAWYDIRSMDISAQEDLEGIRESARQIRRLIENEVNNGIQTKHIVLAGFSQGGAIALYTALNNDFSLAGIMVLSSYLPVSCNTPSSASQQPVFYAHGEDDPVIPVSLAEQSREKLATSGFSVEWHKYKMPHSVCAEEIKDISNWLSSVLAG